MQIYLQYFNKNSSTAVPSRNAQSPLEQIVRSEAKISTVSLGADRSERSEDKNGTKNFWDIQIKKNYSKLSKFKQRPMAYYSFIAELKGRSFSLSQMRRSKLV